MTTQRALAALLTFLLFALIIVGSVAICRALGSATWGWVIGIGICVLMVVGFLTQKPQPPPPPRRTSGGGRPKPKR